jgi:hypothetical protein
MRPKTTIYESCDTLHFKRRIFCILNARSILKQSPHRSACKTEEEILALFLISRAFRMLSQELRQSESSQEYCFNVAGGAKEFVGLVSTNDHDLVSP